MFPWSTVTRGRFEELTFESAVLRHNPLGDPSTRPLWLHLPPGHHADPPPRYPTYYQPQGRLATHDGDALFEMSYLPNFPKSIRALRDDYHGSFERFWEDFRSRPAFSKPSDGSLLNDWCMSACYSADEDGTVHLPYDVATGEL